MDAAEKSNVMRGEIMQSRVNSSHKRWGHGTLWLKHSLKMFR